MVFSLAPDEREASRYHDELQAIITGLSTGFINVPAEEIDTSITEALQQVGVFADVDRSYVFLIAEDGTTMSNTNEWSRPGITPQIENLQDVPVTTFPWCMERVLRGDTVAIPRVAALPDDVPDKQLLMSEDIQSLLAVPITCRGKVIGFFGFDSVRSEKRWTDDTVSLLKIIGSIFGNAIERKRNEEALRKERDFVSTIIDAAGSLVIVLDPEGRCIRVNRAFTDLTGLSAEGVNEGGYPSLIPASYEAVARSALGKALLGSNVQFECPLKTRTGDERTILWNGTMMRSGSGAGDIIITGSDLTEMRILREQVEQSRRLDSLGRVAATVAHEFNNVLMSIQPFTELIRRFANQPEKVLGAVDRIQDAVKRGGRISQQVMRFARPAEPMSQRIIVSDWTRSLIEEMQPVVAQRSSGKVQIELQLPVVDADVFADPQQLQQVFSNLVLNAADAMPSGGRINIATDEVTHHERLSAPQTDSERWVHWRVTDTGTGISPAVLDRIFEPLFTTKKKGTGLGLAVAHQIIKSHAGTLSVESAPNRGTTVHVFLRLGSEL